MSSRVSSPPHTDPDPGLHIEPLTTKLSTKAVEVLVHFDFIPEDPGFPAEVPHFFDTAAAAYPALVLDVIHCDAEIY